MAIKSYFFNAVLQNGVYDRIYNSEDITSYLDELVSNGVFANPTNQLQVSASSGMNVNVNIGQGWINGHKMINTTILTLEIDASDVLLNRIDRVIFYYDESLRDMGISVLKGTPATTPTAPALTQTDSRYELCLAEITVDKQITAITNSMITDTRSNSSLCGFVAGLIDQIDSTSLFQQYDSAFNEWFTEIKNELVTATLIRKYEGNYVTLSDNESTFNVKTYVPEYSYELDILEVRINGLSLASNEYVKSNSSITLNTPITHAGTPVSFVIYKSVDGSDAESVVDAVVDLQSKVDVIERGMYVATGVNDLQKLSEIVTVFIDGSVDDYKQLEIDVYGDLDCSTPADSSGSIAYWFQLGDDANENTRRVKLNFAHASRIVIDGSSYDTNYIFSAENKNVEISNLQLVLNNGGTAYLFSDTTSPTVEDSAFWLNGTALVGGYQGTFTRSRLSLTGTTGATYGFSANGGILRLNDCEIIAYNASSSSAESVAVQVQGGQTSNVLIMNGCSCPIRARNTYKQSNVVKINSGYYALTNNILGMASLKYNTGDGMTENGTMLISK